MPSIAPTEGSLERDVRFLYCACAVSYMLNDWRGLNIESSVDYAKRLQVKETKSRNEATKLLSSFFKDVRVRVCSSTRKRGTW